MEYVTRQMIKDAQRRLQEHLSPTPIDDLGAAGLAKLEIFNPGHSFKIRGALNAALLNPNRHLITASNGNHGIALALAGKIVGSEVTVVLPATAAEGKRRRLADLEAEVHTFGNSLDEAEVHARKLATQRYARYVSAYNDSAIIAGAGVIGLEIVEECPDAERIYVPAGGGGLVAGIALAVAKISSIEVIACCPDQSTALMAAVQKSGKGIPGPSIADALVGGIEAKSITIDILRELGVRFELTTENQIEDAVRELLRLGWLVEPGGAVAVAATWANPGHEGRSVSVISGSNIDPTMLMRIMTNS